MALGDGFDFDNENVCHFEVKDEGPDIVRKVRSYLSIPHVSLKSILKNYFY